MSKKFYLVLIIIVGIISIGGYFFYNQERGSIPDAKQQACLESGGQVEEIDCCEPASNFPNQCKIGACGCAPENSQRVKICNCGKDKCFDGEKCVKSNQAETEANFNEEGYLIKYGEEGSWGLNYEEPGKPALVVTFEFKEDSICDLAEGKKSCSDYEQYGEVGDRVKVIGNKKDGVVQVSKLIYIK